MTQGRDQREDKDDIHQTMDGMADGYSRDNLGSPMMAALWVLGLFSVGTTAFVLSALVAAR